MFSKNSAGTYLYPVERRQITAQTIRTVRIATILGLSKTADIGAVKGRF